MEAGASILYPAGLTQGKFNLNMAYHHLQTMGMKQDQESSYQPMPARSFNRFGGRHSPAEAAAISLLLSLSSPASSMAHVRQEMPDEGTKPGCSHQRGGCWELPYKVSLPARLQQGMERDTPVNR